MASLLSCSWCGCQMFVPISSKLASCMDCGELKATDEIKMTSQEEAQKYLD